MLVASGPALSHIKPFTRRTLSLSLSAQDRHQRGIATQSSVLGARAIVVLINRTAVAVALVTLPAAKLGKVRAVPGVSG